MAELISRTRHRLLLEMPTMQLVSVSSGVHLLTVCIKVPHDAHFFRVIIVFWVTTRIISRFKAPVCYKVTDLLTPKSKLKILLCSRTSRTQSLVYLGNHHKWFRSGSMLTLSASVKDVSTSSTAGSFKKSFSHEITSSCVLFKHVLLIQQTLRVSSES